MKELLIDASSWATKDEMYLSFFEVVGAPPWHGKNLDALSDSIGNGQINRIEVPYCLVLKNYDCVPPSMKLDAAKFVSLIRELEAAGIPVQARIENSN